MIIIYSQWLVRNASPKLAGQECQFLDVVQGNAVRMERLLSALRRSYCWSTTPPSSRRHRSIATPSFRWSYRT